MPVRDLTNLEAVALAHLQKMGPSTAHELRIEFASSSAGRYSGSAGAIYPLVKRLEKAGYLKGAPDRKGAQRRTLFELTAKGRRAVRSWILSMKPSEIFPDDPLRTRFQYIAQLPPAARARWFVEARRALDRLDATIRAEYESQSLQSEVDQLVMDGALDANKQRRRWLMRAEETLAEARA
ncbi:MAG: helix-turn-helix transcriptional regulator [Pseudomonadota bacterium]